ncbi:MAG: hypothetical protein ACXWT1_05710 [Methylobacter sp.]
MPITEYQIKKTVMAICNSFTSEGLNLSDLMPIDEQLRHLNSGFKDGNSKLHGILMLVDDQDNELYDFVESYIRRLKTVYERLTARGKKLAKTTSNNTAESDPLGR